jgi:Ca-activated chloride channel family protein
MNRAITAPVLEPVGEGMVALQSVNVEAEIENLLCQVTVKQSYRNLEKVNIEAVYTFPLPLRAVLLEMTIKTRTKELKGIVVERSEAEDQYEDAITEGDTAIMLEQVDAGLYTMNLGNLQPEETIDISITYAELFKWQDNSLRFFLPTTVAPRYGDPDSLGIQPHQTPEYDLVNENPFTITLSISGVLSRAAIESPSHKVVSESRNGKRVVALKEGQALMDRDFVLNLSMETDEKSAAHVELDGDGYVALASFHPRLPSTSERTARCITIIVDCSGSMGGDAIAQARGALYEILELLRPEDLFNVVRFGSSHQMLFPSPAPADAGNLKTAKNLLEVMDADMGGTEIGQAVAAAVNGATRVKFSKEALLITDGEVWEWEEVTKRAAESGVRFFTVGVGSSVSEAFVQTLADVTGGACELVSPREEMAEKIVRHFKRIYFPKAANAKIRWPGEPEKTVPEQVSAVYDGDTLHVYGRFKGKPEGDVELRADLENGGTLLQRVPLQDLAGNQPSTDQPGTTARMAAASEMRAMAEPEAITALGVKYQLISRFTNYLAIDVKAEAEKAKDLPALRKTPQMLAAGWGGAGTVVQDMGMMYSLEAPMFSRRKRAAYAAPMVQDRVVDIEDSERRKLDRFIDRLNRLQAGLSTPGGDLTSIRGLEIQGVPDELMEALLELVDDGLDEETAVTLFLYLLSQHKRFKKRLSRTTKRILAKACKQLSVVPAEDQQRVKTIIEDYLKTIGS